MTSEQRPWLLLLGGSFNPPHNGHLRMLLEAREALRPLRTLLVPCSVPPHKTSSNLLPFELRCRMLRAALSDMENPGDIAVSEVEREREGPSYTADTVRVLAERHPEARLAFVLGSDDFKNMGTWPRYGNIAKFADLIVMPRGTGNQEEEAVAFGAACKRLWPEAKPAASPGPETMGSYALPQGGRFLFLTQPRLEISSSLVRERWLDGQPIDFLVPCGVAAIIRKQAEEIRSIWLHGAA